MPGKTAIGWTEYTWNFVTGCDRVTAGCDNCYALTLAARLKAMGSARYQNDGDPRTSGPGFGVTLHRDLLNAPRQWPTPRLVFVNSMSDLFHARVPFEFLAEAFKVMAETPLHTYQILTKRSLRLLRVADRLPWPPNVWMGVTVENADTLYRMNHLRAVPAAVRFVSAEPLLGPLTGIDLTGIDLTGIDQVITGGESGPRHRPIDPDWVRAIRDECLRNKVAFFHKQWGGLRPKSNGNLLDEQKWEQLPFKFVRPAATTPEPAPAGR
jgi:protein gp37